MDPEAREDKVSTAIGKHSTLIQHIYRVKKSERVTSDENHPLIFSFHIIVLLFQLKLVYTVYRSHIQSEFDLSICL